MTHRHNEIDTKGRLASLVHTGPAPSGTSPPTLASYGWSFDDSNRLTGFTTSDYSVVYSYDKTDQLKTATYTATSGATLPAPANESYNYDQNGNRTTSYVPSNNQVESDGIYSYQYDDEGNRTRRTDTTTGKYEVYTWDYRNLLTKVEQKTSSGQVEKTIEYRYDPFNRRTAKMVSGATGPATVEHYVYDLLGQDLGADKNIALRFNTNGKVTNRYLNGAAIDELLADEQTTWTGSGTSASSTSKTLWPLANNLGSIRDIVEYNSSTHTTSVVNHISYGAFGQVTYDSAGQVVTSETHPEITHLQGYAGREYDSETKLYNNRARIYDAALGRFLSEDPLGFDAGDANLNRYVENHPTMATDPSGMIAPNFKRTIDEVCSETKWLTLDCANTDRSVVQVDGKLGSAFHLSDQCFSGGTVPTVICHGHDGSRRYGGVNTFRLRGGETQLRSMVELRDQTARYTAETALLVATGPIGGQLGRLRLLD